MNKSEFIDYISTQQNCTKTKAEEIINAFTKAVTGALSEEKTVELVGFGSFHTSKVEARTGRNPKTGEPIEVDAYVQAKFSAGKKLKDACNKKK
jgi:DNA-binding protein HU-beta